LRVLIASVLIVFFDQFTKIQIKDKFYLGESISIWGDVLRLTYVENPGMAFGIAFAGPWFFTTFSFIASIVLVVFLFKLREEKFISRLALALILGGAVGNLIDRFLYGRVIDFLDLGLAGTRWPVFNIADSAVTVGMIFLITMIIFDKDENDKDEATIRPGDKNPADSEERDIWKK